MTDKNKIQIDISVSCNEWPDINDHLEQVALKTLETAKTAEKLGIDTLELSIVLADDMLVQQLNREYRGKDKPTNVLSFPQMSDDLSDENTARLLGDIVLSFETVNKESEEQNKDFKDHTTHLIVHGILHLLGHDHIEDDMADEMERLEVKILEDLGIKNPYETSNFMP